MQRNRLYSPKGINPALAALAVLALCVPAAMAGHVNPNQATGTDAVIGGGDGNAASGALAAIAGGQSNTAVGRAAVVGGGASNDADGVGSTVAGGRNNDALGAYTSVAGGQRNQATARLATVAGGDRNVASGTAATVLGGERNSAAGAHSLAAGYGATAGHDGAFVWNDGVAPFASSDINQFLIAAAGGVGINTNAPTSALSIAGDADATGTITAFAFVGDGSGLTNLPAGGSGIHCWDLNENGVADLVSEDVTADGTVNVADCAGPAGADGAPGTNGAPGADGADGADGTSIQAADCTLSDQVMGAVDASGAVTCVAAGAAFDGDLAGDLEIGSLSDGDDDTITFDGVEKLEWDNSESRLEWSDELALNGPLGVGLLTNPPVGYNRFCQGTCGAGPTSGAISAASDVFTEFDMEVGSGLYLSGRLFMQGNDAPGGDQTQRIWFYEDDSQMGESISWENTFDEFRITDDLTIFNNLRIGLDDTVDDDVIFFDGLAAAESQNLTWDDSEGVFAFSSPLKVPNHMTIAGSASSFLSFGSGGHHISWEDGSGHFSINDDLRIHGAIDASPLAGDPVGFSRICTTFCPTTDSATLINGGDVYIQDRLEVGRDLHLSGQLFMEGASGSDADGDQVINFYDAGERAGEQIMWDDSENQFLISDGVAIDGAISIGLAEAGTRYNRMCSSVCAESRSGSMINAGDLFVGSDLEVGGTVNLNGLLLMNGHFSAGQDGSQIIYFYDEDDPRGESFLWDDLLDEFRVTDDFSVLGNLRIGGSTADSTLDKLFFDGGDNSLEYDPEWDTFRLSTHFEADGDITVGGDLDDAITDRILFDGGGQSLRFEGELDWFKISDTLGVDGSLGFDVIMEQTTSTLCDRTALGGIGFADHMLTTCSDAPADLAEWYPTSGVEAGQIVYATDDTLTYVSDAADPRTGDITVGAEEHTVAVLAPAIAGGRVPLGVVSTSPWRTMGKSVLDATGEAEPIALAGRVPTLVSAENGAIQPGDPITIGALPGVGALATSSGPIVGYALDHYDGVGVGSILVKVDPGYWSGPVDARVDVLERENAELRAELDELRALVEGLVAGP